MKPSQRVKLRFANWGLIPDRTLNMIAELAKDDLVDSARLLGHLTTTMFSPNPHLTEFGRDSILFSILAAQIRLVCRNPQKPALSEIKKILSQVPELKSYRLSTHGRDWTLHLKRPHRALKPGDWAKDRWNAVFEIEGERRFFPLDGCDFLVFLEFFSWLNGDRALGEIKRHFRKKSALLARFFRFAARHDLLIKGDHEVASEPTKAGVALLSHSCLKFKDGAQSLLIDPCLYSGDSQTVTRADYERIDRSIDGFKDVAAILISHNHWDHCHLQTLARFRRDIPIYVPKVARETPYNPSIRNFLRSLGFTNIHEVKNWRTETIGPFRFLPIPFHGEWFGPNSQFDAFCYLIEAGEKIFLGTVDSDRNEHGNMDEVFGKLKKRSPKIDAMFFCSSAQTHAPAFSCGAPWHCSSAFSRLHRGKMRYHPDTFAVLRWCRILRPSVIIPYAEFIFQNAKTRAPLALSPSLDYGAIFKKYWRTSVGPKNEGLIAWKRSLEGLMHRLRGLSIKLLMLGPGEMLGL